MPPQPRLSTYAWVYAWLLAGLAATVALSYFHLGPINVLGMLAVAFAKATLVVLFFMHVRYSPQLVRLAVVAGLLWLAILLALVMSDYSTRHWIPTDAPAQLESPAARASFAPPPRVEAKVLTRTSNLRQLYGS
jgi:cytochrome c oxidase subunit 4